MRVLRLPANFFYAMVLLAVCACHKSPVVGNGEIYYGDPTKPTPAQMDAAVKSLPSELIRFYDVIAAGKGDERLYAAPGCENLPGLSDLCKLSLSYKSQQRLTARDTFHDTAKQAADFLRSGAITFRLVDRLPEPYPDEPFGHGPEADAVIDINKGEVLFPSAKLHDNTTAPTLLAHLVGIAVHEIGHFVLRVKDHQPFGDHKVGAAAGDDFTDEWGALALLDFMRFISESWIKQGPWTGELGTPPAAYVSSAVPLRGLAGQAIIGSPTAVRLDNFAVLFVVGREDHRIYFGRKDLSNAAAEWEAFSPISSSANALTHVAVGASAYVTSTDEKGAAVVATENGRLYAFWCPAQNLAPSASLGGASPCLDLGPIDNSSVAAPGTKILTNLTAAVSGASGAMQIFITATDGSLYFVCGNWQTGKCLRWEPTMALAGYRPNASFAAFTSAGSPGRLDVAVGLGFTQFLRVSGTSIQRTISQAGVPTPWATADGWQTGVAVTSVTFSDNTVATAVTNSTTGRVSLLRYDPRGATTGGAATAFPHPGGELKNYPTSETPGLVEMNGAVHVFTRAWGGSDTVFETVATP